LIGELAGGDPSYPPPTWLRIIPAHPPEFPFIAHLFSLLPRSPPGSAPTSPAHPTQGNGRVHHPGNDCSNHWKWPTLRWQRCSNYHPRRDIRHIHPQTTSGTIIPDGRDASRFSKRWIFRLRCSARVLRPPLETNAPLPDVLAGKELGLKLAPTVPGFGRSAGGVTKFRGKSPQDRLASQPLSSLMSGF
jgi:hypothetical protein